MTYPGRLKDAIAAWIDISGLCDDTPNDGLQLGLGMANQLAL